MGHYGIDKKLWALKMECHWREINNNVKKKILKPVKLVKCPREKLISIPLSVDAKQKCE